jgi:hypothetical protein
MGIIVPYGIQTYSRADLPKVTLLNTYAEAVPSSRAATALFPRPGMVEQSELGDGPINGLFQRSNTLGGDLFTVSGSALYQNTDLLGDLDYFDIVQIAGVDNGIVIAAGDLFLVNGGGFQSIAFPDGAQVSSVAYFGGYTFASRADSRRIYYTLDPTTWDGLDYVSAEQSTDPVVGLAIGVDQMSVFCASHTEFFYLTGDADAPIQRVQGKVFDKGARTRNAICNFDNTIIWVGSDNIVYRVGNEPDRISDHGIEQAIIASSDCSGWVYNWFGHLFYVLQLDTETLIYDAATQQWHEAGSYGLGRWRARVGIQSGAAVTVGDDVTGKIWTLSSALFADGDDPMQRVFTVLLPDPVFADSLSIDITRGKASTPETSPAIIEMRTSRDEGETFLDWRQRDLGRQGEYRKRVAFTRLGLVDQDGMLVQFRITDPVLNRVSSVSLNDSAGGRSR